MRRWLRILLLCFILLIVLAAFAIQIVLWTDFPRRLVLGMVQQQLGLRVEAGSLSTGWTGHTVLHDVKLSLPLADQSFLDVPQMKVTHTWLLPLLVTRHFELDGIELSKPELVVRRDSSGKWNLQEVAQLIQRASSGELKSGTKSKPPKLPRLLIDQATVNVIELSGDKTVIAPVTVKGYPDGSLVYHYDAEVPDKKLKVVGQVAPGEQYKHQFSFYVQPGEWMRLWIAHPPTPLVINGKWEGLIANDTLLGRLTIQESQVGAYGGAGTLQGEFNKETSQVMPRGFVITTPLAMTPRVKIASGTVLLSGSSVTLHRVRIGAMNGLLQLDGNGDLAAGTADLSGAWHDIITGLANQNGNFQVNVKSAFPARPEVTANINTSGALPQGSWNGHIDLNATGRSWDEMDWKINVGRLAWNSKTSPATIENLSADVRQNGSRLELTQVRWPTAQELAANGHFDLTTRDWLLRTRGRGVIPPTFDNQSPTPFDFNFDADGNEKRLHLNEIFIRVAGVDFHADGDYVTNLPKPLSLSLYANRRSSAPASENALLTGRLHSEGHLNGTISPLDLAFTGTARGYNLVVLGHPSGDVHGNVIGQVTADAAQFNVNELTMLGGQWTIDGHWPHEDKHAPEQSDDLRVNVGLDHLSLKEVGDLLKVRGVDGSVRGKWTIDVAKLKPEGIIVDGAFSGENLSLPHFHADSITGETKLTDGKLRIDPIQLHEGEKGEAKATIEATLDNITKPSVTVSVQGWPEPIAGASTAVWADATLAVDAQARSATGPIKARALFATTQQAVGEATIEGHLDGRAAALDTIKIDGAGGVANGHARIDGDDPSSSMAVLTWSGIQGERLADLLPAMHGLSGKFDGAITLDPADSSRALAPLRLKLQLNPTDGKFRTVDIKAARLSAFMKLDSNFGLQRIVLDELPSEDAAERAREADLDAKNVPQSERPLGWNDLRLADGRLKLWARRGEHPDGDIQTHVIADFWRLDLNQVIHAVHPTANPMPGRLAGEIIVHGDPKTLDQVIGDGHLELSDSNLAQVQAFAVLYNAFSLGTAPKQPNGAGSLDLSLQNSTLTLNDFHYFNRGIEALSSDIRIGNIWDFPRSTVLGYLTGTARPLSALKLPLLADVDQIMSVLQSNLTTVKFEGTADNYKVVNATLSDATAGLQLFLRGEMSSDKEKK